MKQTEKSTALYRHPFSKAYWRDAAAELKDTKMLIVTALMIALRIALKPLAIPLGPQLSIQTAMLATALGAMVYGPVVAIPSAMISDTIGFLLYPTGDYFLPFILTEIASTMIYALCLYRADKVTPFRVMLSRFLICSVVNVVLQQFIFAWWYVYIGSPEDARKQIMGIMTLSRILKNVCMFPIESVVLSLFLRLMMPVLKRAKLVNSAEEMKFGKKQVITLVVLTLVGIFSATGYLGYRYGTSSRSADYTAEERLEANNRMIDVVKDNTDDWDDETMVCIVDSAYRGLFQKNTDYTVAVYVVDETALADYDKSLDAIRGMSKSKAKAVSEDGVMSRVATVTVTMEEKTGEILSFQVKDEG